MASRSSEQPLADSCSGLGTSGLQLQDLNSARKPPAEPLPCPHVGFHIVKPGAENQPRLAGLLSTKL